MTFLRRWWGALLAVLAAIAAGVGIFLTGRRSGAAGGNVATTEAEGDRLVADAEAEAGAVVTRADDELRETVRAIDDSGESGASVFNRLADRD